jgi:hypothetical protein
MPEKKGDRRGSVRRSGARARDEKPTPAEEAAEATRLKKLAFLAAYSSCASRTKAANAIGIDRTTHYIWLREDAEYKKRFDELAEVVADMLEDEALRRAHDGVQRFEIGRIARDQDGQILDKEGKPIVRVEYSDRLLELLLKANRPDKFRERREITGKNGGPINYRDVSAMSDEELDAEIARIEAEEAAASSGTSAKAPVATTTS